MITVTERAANELQELLTNNNAEPGQGVKLVPSGENRFGMSIGTPAEDDEVIRRGDEPLLIVDSRIAAALDGSEIDCETATVDGQRRTEFKLRQSA